MYSKGIPYNKPYILKVYSFYGLFQYTSYARKLSITYEINTQGS